MKDVNLKPRLFPRHIFEIAAAIPPHPTLIAENAFLSAISWWIFAKFVLRRENTGRSCASCGTGTMTTVLPGYLNSGERASFAGMVVTANATRVGGTFRFSNVPDMESLPPIAGIPISCCARSAPRSAANGLPHFFGSVPSRSKYSCRVRRTRSALPPVATIFATASTMA